MKKIIVLSCLVLAGCTPLLIEKEIRVEKDPQGNIIKTIYIERATEQVPTLNTITFEYLKNKSTDAQPMSTYVGK